MSQKYDSHSDYMEWVEEDAQSRKERVNAELIEAFSEFLGKESTPIIRFDNMNVRDLSAAIQSNPVILKALMASCNVAGRAIERDVGVRGMNTYEPRLKPQQAMAVAKYVKCFLPDKLQICALVELDRHFFVDKTIRAMKGRWEKQILSCLNAITDVPFAKRKFSVGHDDYELDAAAPATGDVEFGVDVKRIEARKDTHKRSDEVVNKAVKLKSRYPDARFGAVVYYPFEHGKLRDRLESPAVDAVEFASSDRSQMKNAIHRLADSLGIPKKR